MVLLVVQLALDDYDAWRAYFDDSLSDLERHGVVEARAHRGIDDENSVMVVLRIATPEQAYALVEDTELLARFEAGDFRAFSSVVRLYEE